jgi:hypothetical protein
LYALLTLSQPEYIALSFTPGGDIGNGGALKLMIHEHETNKLSKADFKHPGPRRFSKRSTGAASFALGMVPRFNAKITLLHVEKPD